MKVVTPQQMSRLESLAYRNGASESDFMEEAGSGVALIAHDYVENQNLNRHVILLCGKGNNAGDAYVAGVQLLHLDYEVTAYQLFSISESSNLCRHNHFSFINEGGTVKEISSSDEMEFPSSGIIIDGIFGTGFHGSVDETLATIIRAVNHSKLPIIAVDIPSGLNGKTGEVGREAIVATITAFLGLPKTGFFLRDGWNHVGTLSYVDFGLSKEYFSEIESNFVMLSPDILSPLMPEMKRNRHKYEAGHVVGLAGSIAMPGASLLSSLSCLCSGAGIVHLLHPKGMEKELASVPYELIKVPYGEDDYKTVLELMNRATATFIGPGLGVTKETRKLLQRILPKLEKPCVLDADALNIIAEDKLKIPSQAILTPHIGELKRLLNKKEIKLTSEFLTECQTYAVDNSTTLVLKGGPTFIFHRNGSIYVCSKGDPGMATAGSGDVLTGLLASLLAQGLLPQDAAMLGVYIHGLAGEHAAMELTSYCMTASDIITYFPDAFRSNTWMV